MTVECFQRRLQLHRQAQRVERFSLAAPLLGHALADVIPQVAEDRHLFAGDVVGHRHTWQLDDPALDGVHQREVAHRPGEERAFGVARAAQKERRRRQIDDAGEPKLAVDRFQPRNPETRRLVVLVGFLFVVTFEVAFFVDAWPLAIAVVRLVIDGEDILEPHQVRHDALEHLALGFQGHQFRPASLQQCTPTLGQIHALA